MVFLHIYILFGSCLTFVYPYRTDTWPPIATIYKHYDIDNITAVCTKQSGVDRKEVTELEMTKDLEHLPDSHELKVYIRCFGVMTEAVEATSNKVMLGKVSNFFADLTREEQEIYVNMSRGCVKRAKAKKDLLEFTYEYVICTKQNDNEVKQKKMKLLCSTL